MAHTSFPLGDTAPCPGVPGVEGDWGTEGMGVIGGESAGAIGFGSAGEALPVSVSLPDEPETFQCKIALSLCTGEVTIDRPGETGMT